MNSAERRARVIFQAGNRAVALAVSAFLLALLGFGIGTVPALGPALVPGHGAWRAGTVGAEGVNPGGQVNRLAPPPYSDLAGAAQTGTYLPARAAGAAASPGAISRKLRP